MARDKEIFSQIVENDENDKLQLGSVLTGNGQRVSIYGYGKVGIHSNVLFLPHQIEAGFVISPGQLTRSGLKIVFEKNEAKVFDQKGWILMKGLRTNENLYEVAANKKYLDK